MTKMLHKRDNRTIQNILKYNIPHKLLHKKTTPKTNNTWYGYEYKKGDTKALHYIKFNMVIFYTLPSTTGYYGPLVLCNLSLEVNMHN